MMQEYLTYNQIIKDQAVSSDTTTPWISRNAEALCPLASLHLVGAATFPVSFWSLQGVSWGIALDHDHIFQKRKSWEFNTQGRNHQTHQTSILFLPATKVRNFEASNLDKGGFFIRNP